MVKYTCENCLKDFSRKSDYIYHIEKKKNPCRQIIPVLIENLQKTPKNDNKYIEKIVSKVEENEENEEIVVEKNMCNYCGFNFARKDNLSKHLKGRCKVKNELDQEKEKMFNLLIQKKDEVHEKELKEKDEQLKKLELMIKEQNDKITELIKKIKPSNITNNNTLNNIVIKPVINKFGHENLDKLLNKKQFEDKVLLLTGSNAFQACAEMIYNNPKHPENQTVYCTDLSREKFMVFTGEDWELNTRNEVFTEVQNKIQEYIDMHEEELQDKLKNPDFKEKFYNRIGKFYTKYYGNKNEKDSGFENKTDEQLMRFFYKIKEMVKNNYNVLYNKALELESKKVLDNKQVLEIEDKKEDEPIRKRGRPKKQI